MNYLVRFLLPLIIFLPQSAPASSDTILIVVNEGNKQIFSEEDLRNIYGDLLTHWNNGEGIKLYELSPKSILRETFYQKTLGISASESARRWNNRKVTNTMKNISPKVRRESSVASAVARDSNAIGYISEMAAVGKSGLRIVMRIE